MPLIDDTTSAGGGEGERRSRISIRKRTTTTSAAESNIHSSMVTVPEESDYPATSEGDTAGGASSNSSGSGGGIVLDDSIKSDSGSLIDKMQNALNEEWWSKRQQDWQDQNASPVPAVLQSEEDRAFAVAQQSAGAGEGKNNNKKRGLMKTDFFFGILLLSVGFVVGGICIHYDKIMMEMNSLWNVASGGGGGGGGSSSSSNAALLREGTRQLPLIDEHDEYHIHHHPLSYEERQQLYREQRMAGTLRLGQTGYYQQHN